MKTRTAPNGFLLLVCLLLFTLNLSGDEEEETDSQPSFAETIKSCRLLDGLFNLYQDREEGTVYLSIKKEQIGREYLHFAYVLDGIASLSTYRGRFLDESIFTIRKWFNKIEFVTKNTAFYVDPTSALSRSAEANISDAVIASLDIIATSEDKTTYLVKADELFLDELFSVIKSPTDSEEEDRLELGKLSKERTRFEELKNYPWNTLLRINYTYHNEEVKEWGGDDVTDARYITAKVQHAFITIPKSSSYRERFEDPRVGYFTSRKTDLTSKESANYRDVINRWHLQKKHPGSKLSEPVKPITWWIENTTPHELRGTIREAVEAWNLAFESAGFKNAIVCRVQPDDATWDAGDIRYNVLRWTSSPDPPFGGYGPSFVNPRTGEIIGADIMLEYVYITNRVRLRKLLQAVEPVKMDRNRFPFNRQSGHQSQSRRGALCLAGHLKQDDAIAARASLLAAGATKVEVDQLIKEALFELILHEVGHTLGLSHNFHASYLHTPDQLHDRKRTEKLGTISSVMDYSPANISRNKDQQGQYYSSVPGPYDHWAIRYGYTQTTAENEATVLADILAESTKPEHAFGNDADDMRSPGFGIDPRIMINDLSSDPIAHAIDSMERVRESMGQLLENYPKKDDSYHEMRSAASSLMRTYQRAGAILSRHVGGVYIDRSFHGQKDSAPLPYRPVKKVNQERALKAIAKYTMEKGAFDFLSADLIAHLQLQRRGFSNWDLDANEDPKIHSEVQRIQDEVLDHLLHKNTLQRVIDTSLYGNELPIDNMMGTLQSMIMEGEVDSFREDLQINYIKRLAEISGLEKDNNFPSHAQSQAVFFLEQIAANVERPSNAHETHLKRLVTNALEGK